MAQSHAHLGFAPQGAGLLYGMLWLPHGDDVLGWFIGDRGGAPLAAYFVLQDYYVRGEPHFLRSLQDDVYGPWVEATASGEAPRPQPVALPEQVGHELVRMQEQFIRHWLFSGDDPAASVEADALRARSLPVRAINVRADRLDKFRTDGTVWRYDEPGADTGVLVKLSRLWPLDGRVED